MGFKGHLKSDSNVAVPATGSVAANTLADMLEYSVGRSVTKLAHKLDGNGAQADNIFQVTGVVRVNYLAFTVVTATDSTTLSGMKFEVDDGTAQTDITAAVDGSGCVAGALFYKRDLLASALGFVNPTAGAVGEPGGDKKMMEPFFALQKTGAVNTYIRLAFTGDANTDVDVNFESRFTPVSTDGNLVSA
jgi:hypothetical protein